MNFQCQ